MEDVVAQETAISRKKRARRSIALMLLAVVLILAWVIIRPGAFTVQPIGALPQGITFIYHSRGSEMPFFSSPDGLCLQTQGSVSLLCRAAALEAIGELSDRIVLRLPYSEWAYLRSTGGRTFDR